VFAPILGRLLRWQLARDVPSIGLLWSGLLVDLLRFPCHSDDELRFAVGVGHPVIGVGSRQVDLSVWYSLGHEGVRYEVIAEERGVSLMLLPNACMHNGGT